jgi:hypothetical protein
MMRPAGFRHLPSAVAHLRVWRVWGLGCCLSSRVRSVVFRHSTPALRRRAEMAATRAASQPEQRIFDRSGCALLVNTAEPSAPPVFSEVETTVCVRITRSPAGVLLGSGSKDEGKFTPEGAKHDHHLQVLLPSGECLLKARLHGGTQHCRLGSHTYVWTPDAAATATTDGSPSVVSRGFQFRKASDCAGLAEAMTTVTRGGAAASQFDSTRADSSADHYFHYYGQLMFQQNMLSDSVRTQLYRRAVFENQMDFRGKVVVDVGCGSGILSFFAAQAGARKVYAIEASRAADDAELLVSVGPACKHSSHFRSVLSRHFNRTLCAAQVKTNGYADIITIVRGKVEEVTLPEDCDIIISEPMGTLLVNERSK